MKCSTSYQSCNVKHYLWCLHSSTYNIIGNTDAEKVSEKVSDVNVVPKFRTAKLDQSVSFQCNGGPSGSQIDWTFNNIPLPASVTWDYKTPNVIRIKKVQKDNAGLYICHLRDKHEYTVGHAGGVLFIGRGKYNYCFLHTISSRQKVMIYN